MAGIVPIALAAWVVACVALFWRLPARDAAVVALVGGWALLPTGAYPASDRAGRDDPGVTTQPVVVPTAVRANKATAIGLGCLAGASLFGWPVLRRVRPSWLDLPVVAW